MDINQRGPKDRHCRQIIPTAFLAENLLPSSHVIVYERYNKRYNQVAYSALGRVQFARKTLPGRGEIKTQKHPTGKKWATRCPPTLQRKFSN
jgi:hypothetical protein